MKNKVFFPFPPSGYKTGIGCLSLEVRKDRHENLIPSTEKISRPLLVQCYVSSM